MKRLFAIITFAVCAITWSQTAFAQSPPKPKSTSQADSVTDGAYTNSRLGFSLQFPKAWVVLNREDALAAGKVGLDVLKGKDAKDNKAMEDSLNVEVILLHLTKKPLGAQGNAGFVLASRRLPSRAITPSMLAEATQSLFDSSPTIKLVTGTRTRFIGTKKVAFADYRIGTNEQGANLRAFFSVVDDHAVTFSLTYSDEADLVELNKIVESLKFTR